MSTQITYLGHCSVLIQKENVSFLTDPILSEHGFWFQESSKLPFRPEDIPEPTAIFISQAHYNHLDIPTFKYFSSKVPIIVPKGLGNFLRRFIQNDIIELAPESTYVIKESFQVTAFPVNHFSFRVNHLNYRHCTGYFIEMNGFTTFFPGNTGYCENFSRFPKPDLAILPVGPCWPAWLMKKRYLTPEDALRILDETSAKKMLPIYWKAKPFSWERDTESRDKLNQLIQERNLGDRLLPLSPGQNVTI